MRERGVSVIDPVTKLVTKASATAISLYSRPSHLSMHAKPRDMTALQVLVSNKTAVVALASTLLSRVFITHGSARKACSIRSPTCGCYSRRCVRHVPAGA